MRKEVDGVVKFITENEVFYGESEISPVHRIILIDAVKKELESDDVTEIIIKKSADKKKMTDETEFELVYIDTLIRLAEREKIKHSEENECELRNVLHNCIIRLNELKGLKVNQDCIHCRK